MKAKLLLILLSIILIPGTSFAVKPDSAGQSLQPGHVVFADANGVMLGDAQIEVSRYSALIYFDVNEQLYFADLQATAFRGNLWYDRPGCMGNAYVEKPRIVNGAEELVWFRGGIFYTAGSEVPQTFAASSRWDELNGNTVCNNHTPTLDFYPAAPIVDTNVYMKP